MKFGPYFSIKLKRVALPGTKVWIFYFKSRLSLIVQVNVDLNRTVVVDSDWHFKNLCGSHLQSQSESYHVSWWYCTQVIDLIGQLCRDVVRRLSVKPWSKWMQNNKEVFVIVLQIPFHVDLNVTEASVRVLGPLQHF